MQYHLGYGLLLRQLLYRSGRTTEGDANYLSLNQHLPLKRRLQRQPGNALVAEVLYLDGQGLRVRPATASP